MFSYDVTFAQFCFLTMWPPYNVVLHTMETSYNIIFSQCECNLKFPQWCFYTIGTSYNVVFSRYDLCKVPCIHDMILMRCFFPLDLTFMHCCFLTIIYVPLHNAVFSRYQTFRKILLSDHEHRPCFFSRFDLNGSFSTDSKRTSFFPRDVTMLWHSFKFVFSRCKVFIRCYLCAWLISHYLTLSRYCFLTMWLWHNVLIMLSLKLLWIQNSVIYFVN